MPTRSEFLPATPLALLTSAVAFVAIAAPAAAQVYRFDDSSEPAHVIDRVGSSLVLQADGPALFPPREFYRPVPPLELSNRWVIVQDSTTGVVFSQPSGVKPDAHDLHGDLYLRLLDGVYAVEVRALVFNVWGELSGYLSVTVLGERRVGDKWEIHPRWNEAPHTEEHRTSIVWVNRVMFADESVLEAGLDGVARAWTHVTGSEFEGLPQDSLRRATGR